MHVAPCCCFSSLARFFRVVAVLLFSVFCCSVPVFGAGLTDDRTILYYLIEMQRRVHKNCNGAPMPEAPSLLPSNALAHLAGEVHPSGANLESELTANGFEPGTVFHAFAHAQNPQQAFAEIKERHCASLAEPSYRFVGAAYTLGVWSVFLAPKEPVAVGSRGGVPRVGTDLNASGEDLEVNFSDPEVPPPPPPADQLLAPPSFSEVTRAPRPGVTPLQPEIEPQPVVATPGAAPAVPPFGGSPAPSENPVPLPSQSSDSGHPTPFVPAAPRQGASLEDTLLDLVNQVRARGYRCGSTVMPIVPPLNPSPALAAVASRHARDMTLRGYFSSTSPDGVTLGARLSDAGYLWTATAENIAQVSPPASAAIQNWLNNETQCKNLLSPVYSEGGGGYDSGKRYWVFTMAAAMRSGDFPEEIPATPQTLPGGRAVTLP